MPKFDGRVTIRVRFKNRIEYEKFRKYILKTGWAYDVGHPQYESLVVEFHSVEDVEHITRTIVQLLQQGFNIWLADFSLTEIDPAELESPTDDEPEEEDGEVDDGEIENRHDREDN